MAETRLLISIAAQDQFSGQFTSLNRSLYYTSSTLGILSGRLNEIAAPFEEFVSLIFKTTAAVGGLSAAVAGFSSKVAADFETRIAEIGTLVKGTADEAIPGLTEEILRLGTELPQKLEDLGQAFYYVQSAMPGNTENLAVLEQAAKGATIGLTDTLTVADALTTVMNSFGQSTEDQAVVALNKMFGAVVEGKITMETLAENIGSVSAAAASANLAMEDLFGAFAIATRVTGQASRSATGLRAALLAIAKPSVAARKAWDEFGISIRNSDGSIRNLIDILGDVAEKQLNFNQISALFPRARTIATIQALVSHYDELREAIGVVGNASEITAEALDEQLGTLNNKLTITGNLFDELAVAVGSNLNKYIKEVVDSLNNLLKVIIDFEKEGSGISDIFKELFGDALSTVSRALDTLAENFDDIINNVDFSGLKQEFVFLKDAVTDLFDVDLTTAEGWTDLFQNLVDIMTTLTGVATGFFEVLDPIVDVLTGLAESVGDTDGSFGEFIGNIAGASIPITTLMHALSGLAEVIAFLVDIAMLGALISAFPALGAAALGVIGTIGGWIGLLVIAAVKIEVFLSMIYLVTKAIQWLATRFDFVNEKIDKFQRGLDRIIILNKKWGNEAKTIEEVNKKYGTHVKTIEEAYDIILKNSKAYKDHIDVLNNASKATHNLDEETKNFGDDLLTLDQIVAGVKKQFDDLEKAEKNLAILFGAIGEKIGGISEADKKRGIEELTKEIIKLGGSLLDIATAEIKLDVEGLDDVKKKSQELSDGVKLGIVDFSKFLAVTDDAIEKLAKTSVIAVESIRNVITPMQFLAVQNAKLQESFQLSGNVLTFSNAIKENETRIRELAPALQKTSGIMGVTAGKAARMYAQNIRDLSAAMGDTETAGKSLEQIVKENVSNAFDYGTQSSVDYTNAINQALQALGTLNQFLPDIKDNFGLVRQSMGDTETILLSLFDKFIGGKISLEDLNKSLQALGPTSSNIESAFSKIKDEEATEAVNKLKEALIVLGNAPRDLNVAIDNVDENLSNAANSSDLLKKSFEVMKGFIESQAKTLGTLSEAAGKADTGIKNLLTTTSELDKSLSVNRKLDLNIEPFKLGMWEAKNSYDELLAHVQSHPIQIVYEESVVEAT